MKNLLSENMLRFGTKNLTESEQRKLVLHSIMKTINDYGLHSVVIRKLNEQAVSYPLETAPIDTLADFEAEVNTQDENEPDPNKLEQFFAKIEAAFKNNILQIQMFDRGNLRRFNRKLKNMFRNFRIKNKRSSQKMTNCFNFFRD